MKLDVNLKIHVFGNRMQHIDNIQENLINTFPYRLHQK